MTHFLEGMPACGVDAALHWGISSCWAIGTMRSKCGECYSKYSQSSANGSPLFTRVIYSYSDRTQIVVRLK